MSVIPFDLRDGYLWLDGKLVEWKDAKLHVLSHGLHYASSVFEGERAYGGKIYKSTEHSERFHRSAEILDFKIPYSVAELDAAKALVVEKNGFKNCYVRPVAWRGSEMMAVAAQHATIHVAIATWDWPSMFDVAQKMKGIRLDIADYRRPDPQTAPCDSKAAGLYMICTISKHRAERKGYADAMMLDWQGRVAECTGANIFFTQGGKIHTPSRAKPSSVLQKHAALRLSSAALCRKSLRALTSASSAVRAQKSLRSRKSALTNSHLPQSRVR